MCIDKYYFLHSALFFGFVLSFIYHVIFSLVACVFYHVLLEYVDLSGAFPVYQHQYSQTSCGF